MTPSEINTAARQRYNAVGDDFWSDTEVYNLIFQGCLELATEALMIERVFTTSTVASQQEYSWPTNAIAIKRITYAGKKLDLVSFREDDTLTLVNQATTSTGTPQYYALWNDVFYLRPIPASVATLKVWAYVEPQAVSSSSTLEIPTEFHMSLVNFILSEMSAKNKNYQGAKWYKDLWDRDVARAKRMTKKKMLGDSFQVVKNVDILPQTILGNI